MSKLEKFGYILIGFGIGGLVSTFIYKRELDKPIGEEEEYIPHECKEESEDTKTEDEVPHEEFSDARTHLSDIYQPSSPTSIENDSVKESNRKEDFNKRRASGKNQKTLYSKMYRSDVTDRELLYHSTKESSVYKEMELDSVVPDDEVNRDIPNDDTPYEEDVEALDNELVRERVENNIEIYLGENPQEFATLIYYQGDQTMTDDQEQLVPNPDDVVGRVAISRLIEGGPGGEEGVIYVRNLKTMINYEVVLDAGSYKETVLGILNSRRNNGADRSGSTR